MQSGHFASDELPHLVVGMKITLPVTPLRWRERIEIRGNHPHPDLLPSKREGSEFFMLRVVLGNPVHMSGDVVVLA